MNYNAILHIDSKDSDRFRLVARNATNYLNSLPNEKFELVIVANGEAATLFHEDEGFLSHLSQDAMGRNSLHAIAQGLMARGVKIKVCANALAEHDINPDTVWQGCEIVPAGIVEVVRLQKEGYAYIKP